MPRERVAKSLIREILVEKCSLFYPKRGLLCKQLISKLLDLEDFVVDVHLKVFWIRLPNKEILEKINFMDFLEYATDPDVDKYIFSVEMLNEGVKLSDKMEKYDALIAYLNFPTPEETLKAKINSREETFILGY